MIKVSQITIATFVTATLWNRAGYYIFILWFLSIYLSIDRSIYRSIYLSIYLSIDLSIYRSIYLSIYLSIDLSIYRSIYRSIYLSVFFFFSSPDLSGRTLDIYRTLTHSVALVRI